MNSRGFVDNHSVRKTLGRMYDKAVQELKISRNTRITQISLLEKLSTFPRTLNETNGKTAKVYIRTRRRASSHKQRHYQSPSKKQHENKSDLGPSWVEL